MSFLQVPRLDDQRSALLPWWGGPASTSFSSLLRVLLRDDHVLWGWPAARRAAGRVWWTRNERTRTVAALSLDQALLDDALVPPYQRLAGAAAALRASGWSDHAIAVDFGVTDETIAKAIRWLRGRPGLQAD